MTYAEEKAECARALFLQGYTCSQAICSAFATEMGIPEETLLRLSSSFGGGMGRLREVCGAVSGAFMVLGAIYGEGLTESHSAKAAHYQRVQELAAAFRAQNGSIVCRELLGLSRTPSDPTPEPRTAEYYKKRPCPQLIADAAYILATYLAAHPKGSA